MFLMSTLWSNNLKLYFEKRCFSKKCISKKTSECIPTALKGIARKGCGGRDEAVQSSSVEVGPMPRGHPSSSSHQPLYKLQEDFPELNSTL